MNDSKVVYIVEDDPSFRKSMVRLVGTAGFDVVTFDSANAFLAHTSIRRPACLLLDVKLPDIDGLCVQERLNDCGNSLPVIFMTGHGTIPMSVQAMKSGAVDFLPKPFQTEELFRAIDKAIERDSHHLQEQREKDAVNRLIDTLTPREKEVLRWLLTGKLNKQIAFEMGITEKTVKVHRSRVLEKTRVSSVAELVRLAEKAAIPPAE